MTEIRVTNRSSRSSSCWREGQEVRIAGTGKPHPVPRQQQQKQKQKSQPRGAWLVANPSGRTTAASTGGPNSRNRAALSRSEAAAAAAAAPLHPHKNNTSAGKDRAHPNTPSPPPPPAPTSTKKAASQRAEDGHSASRNGPRIAARSEYTLFDHLLASTPPQSGSHRNRAQGQRQSRGAGSFRPQHHQRGGGALERHVGTTAQLKPASPSAPFFTAQAKEGSLNGTAAGTNVGGPRAIQNNGGGHVAVVAGGGAGGGGCITGHTKLQRVDKKNNADFPKPGKQRLGPGKKKLSSLKKKILLDRAARWKEQLAPAMECPPPPPPPPPPSPPPPSPDATSAEVLAVDGDDVDVDVATTTDSKKYTVVVIHNLVVKEDVEEDDEHAEVERDLRDMASAFGVVRGVEVPRAEELGRAEAVAAVKVSFATPDAAERARGGLHGRVVGGKALEAEIAGRVMSTGGRCCQSLGCEGCEEWSTTTPSPAGQVSREEQRGRRQEMAGSHGTMPVKEMQSPVASSRVGSERHGGGDVAQKERGEPVFAEGEGATVEDIGTVDGSSPSPAPLWRVVVKNLIDESDEMDDEDKYAEVCADVATLLGAHGRLVALNVPRRRSESDDGIRTGQLEATFGSLAEAEACIFGTRGQRIGGRDLDAELVDPRGLPVSADGWRERSEVQVMGSQQATENQGEDGRTPPGMTAQRENSNGGANKSSGGGTPTGNSKLGATPGQSRGENNAADRWRVLVRNLIEEDDLRDDDDYGEVCADFAAMTSAYGEVTVLDVPREATTGSEGGAELGEAIAVFRSLDEAEACARGLHGCKVGGKSLEAIVLDLLSRPRQREGANVLSTVGRNAGQGDRCLQRFYDGADDSSGGNNSTGNPKLEATSGQSREEKTAAGRWRVLIRNLIEEDDLLDDDDYGEVRADLTAMTSSYGQVTVLDIPRKATTGSEGGAELGEAIAVFGSLEEAEACAQGLHGCKVGGKNLEAIVLDLPPRPGKNKRAYVISTIGRKAGEGDRCLQGSMRAPQSAVLSIDTAVGDTYGLGPGYGGARSGETGGPGMRSEAISAPASGETAAGSHLSTASTAAASAVLSLGRSLTSTAAPEARKRMPEKYKEAAALPKHPGVSGKVSRVYVNQSPDQEINSLVFEMLQTLFKFQERARISDPVKARSKRRLVMGLREVLRAVKAKKVRLLILAPNVDAIGGEGCLDEKVSEIIDRAREGDTPVVFALSKRKIGKALGKSIKVSVVGVYNFDGANELQKQLKRRMEVVSSLPLAVAQPTASA